MIYVHILMHLSENIDVYMPNVSQQSTLWKTIVNLQVTNSARSPLFHIGKIA